jgi:alkylation response protein AidB-like acyl-CoA dehydrogenase
VKIAFTPEHEEWRKSVRAFVQEKSPDKEVRRLMATDDGFDPEVWSQMADQVGFQAVAVPEEYGGLGFGFVELGIVFEEMGRALMCAPLLSTAVLAVGALLASRDEDAKNAYLPSIASGETIATLAVTEGPGEWDERAIASKATRRGGEWRLSGSKTFVPDGHVAKLVLVLARSDNGTSLFAVEAGGSGLSRTAMTTMDQTRKLSELKLDDVPAHLVGTEGEGWKIVAHVLNLAAVAISAECAGGAQQCLDMAVAYAKTRKQFGRVIGSFQAIKHKCADMLLEVESTKSAAYYGMWAAGGDFRELPLSASLAKSYCTEAFFRVAAENIQIHGGIGFTWEHSAHLYFKRAKSSELLFGTPAFHRELMAQHLNV